MYRTLGRHRWAAVLVAALDRHVLLSPGRFDWLSPGRIVWILAIGSCWSGAVDCGSAAEGRGSDSKVSAGQTDSSPAATPIDGARPIRQQDPDPLSGMLAAGEYTLALDFAGRQPAQQRPVLQTRIGDHQRSHRAGFVPYTYQTSDRHGAAGGRLSDHDQYHGLGSSRAASDRLGSRPPSASPQGGGGMMQADFTSLIDLIQSTVEPMSWEDNGGTGAIMSFPNGVLIDVRGQLSFSGPTSSRTQGLLSEPLKPVGSMSTSEMRFVSLPRLEEQLQRLAIEGRAVPDSLRYLGGLYEIQSLAVEPETGDLFLIGPAGPWQVNDSGIAVNMETGRAVLQLDDLVVCLRNVFNGRGVLGCSIDPRPGQMDLASRQAARLNLTLPAVRAQFLTAVGPQVATVFGVPRNSHAAQVLLTADYHIKLLAMGNVSAGPQLPSFLDRSQPDDPPTEVIRWWFTLADPRINYLPDSGIYQIVGPVMELKTQAQLLAGQQAGQAEAPRSLAAERFVSDFNQRLPELRKTFPVYGQLENLFTLAVAAQTIASQGLHEQVGWDAAFFLGRRPGGSSHALERFPEIKEVELVVNHRTLNFRDTRRPGHPLRRQTIVAISGGVEVKATSQRLESLLKAVDGWQSLPQLNSGLRRSSEEFAAVPIGRDQGVWVPAARRWFHD